MAKYIFLDVDGVMSGSGHKKTANANDFKIKLNVSAVNTLNIILDRVPDAKIIITSTYKRSMIIGEIRHNFVEQGVLDRIIKSTPKSDSSDRAHEITRTLSSTRDKVDGFLILDDLEILGFNEHFLQIEGGTLSPDYIEKCIEILNIDVSHIDFRTISKPKKLMTGLELSDTHIKPRNKKNEHTVELFTNKEPKISRNDNCPCGSGKKYKKCCINK